MSQAEYIEELRRVISDSRLRRYLDRIPGADEVQALGVYLWNTALCESLYPVLQAVELSLRNSIHQAASDAFGDDFWFRTRVSGWELDEIQKLDTKLGYPSDRAAPGRYVSECPFAFWVGLFQGKYEQALWPRLLAAVFPHAPRRSRNRGQIHQRLDSIRRLRNRVFHYEPIWHLDDLDNQYDNILETIGWINLAMRDTVNLLDRFPGVYTGGADPYTQQIGAIARNRGAGRD